MLNLIFRSSWKVKAFFAVVLISLSVALYFVSLEIEADKARALESGVPAPVSLNDFDPERDIHAADEVHVIGWVNPDFNYRLTETRKRKRSSYDVTRRMFVLMGPDDTAETRTVRAAVLLDEASVDRFLQEMAANLEGVPDYRLIFRLSGTAERSPELESMADDALDKLGVKKVLGFQYIEPWSKAGRAVDLAPDPDTGRDISLVIAGIGGLFLFMAIWGFWRRKDNPSVAKTAGKAAMGPAQTGTLQPTATVLGGLPGPHAPASDAASSRVAAKGHTPRWLLPLFAVVAVVALGRVYGGGVATGLFMLAVFVFGLIQMKRAINEGLASLFGRGTAKAAPVPVAAPKGPIEHVAGPMERLTSSLKTGSAGQPSSSLGKFMPLAIGIVLMFGGNLVFKQFDLGSMAGVVSLTGPRPEQMAQSPAFGPMEEVAHKTDLQTVGMASSPDHVPDATDVADPSSALAAMPVANIADAERMVVPTPATPTIAVPTPANSGPANASAVQYPAQEPVAAPVSGWLAFAGSDLPLPGAGGILVLLIGGLFLFAPKLRGRLPTRSAGHTADPWARLDRMVARENAISRSKSQVA